MHLAPLCRHLVLGATLAAFAAGCSSSKAAPPPAAPKPRSTAPQGPTRTDFQEIAKKLVSRCVAGGWINEWRSKHENVDVARPKVHLQAFEDKTGQDLDPSYLNGVLEQRMRLSGVYDMVADDQTADFVGQGSLLRMAERSSRGDRVSVYTAMLKLVDPRDAKVAYTCEATVRGEM